MFKLVVTAVTQHIFIDGTIFTFAVAIIFVQPVLNRERVSLAVSFG